VAPWQGVLAQVLPPAAVRGIAGTSVLTGTVTADKGEVRALRVKARDTVRCGVSEDTAGFSQRDANGRWSGIDIDFCRAVSAVHDAGLIHRDIKTQNVMRAEDGRLVLMDFGTGWDLEKAPAEGIDAAGTPLYLAPEIFEGAEATIRSDVYGTGVLLFHLLTGATGERPASGSGASTRAATGYPGPPPRACTDSFAAVIVAPSIPIRRRAGPLDKRWCL
jgi:hypothetical protein